MRFLVDECTGPKVAVYLREKGHDVFSVFEEARGSTDAEILKRAVREDRILITNDKDFGEMIYRERHSHRGVVLLRLDDERAANRIRVLEQLIENHAEKLPGRFVTATETNVRIAGA